MNANQKSKIFKRIQNENIFKFLRDQLICKRFDKKIIVAIVVDSIALRMYVMCFQSWTWCVLREATCHLAVEYVSHHSLNVHILELLSTQILWHDNLLTSNKPIRQEWLSWHGGKKDGWRRNVVQNEPACSCNYP